MRAFDFLTSMSDEEKVRLSVAGTNLAKLGGILLGCFWIGFQYSQLTNSITELQNQVHSIAELDQREIKLEGEVDEQRHMMDEILKIPPSDPNYYSTPWGKIPRKPSGH